MHLMNGSSDEENDKGFASMSAKKSLHENSDSDSDNYNDRKNNNYDDVALGDNLHKKIQEKLVQRSQTTIEPKGHQKDRAKCQFLNL